MPTTATYTHYYGFGTVDPRTQATYPNVSANITSTTLTDDEDGTDDGEVALNGLMSWTASGNVTLIGVTDAGYPVIEDTGFYYILTNSGGLHNTPLVVNAAGYTMCFAAGSLIATPDGEAKVERLEIGGRVTTADGRDVAVKWVGRQTVQKLFHRERAQMVRISAGAPGNELPHSDLTVTADHGMILDGLVINASALVNGTSINWVPMAELADSFTVYHIETEDHDVILANGAASETFVDVATRQGFDNYQEYLEVYSAERVIPEMPTPRISSARLLPAAIKRRLSSAPSPAIAFERTAL